MAAHRNERRSRCRRRGSRTEPDERPPGVLGVGEHRDLDRRRCRPRAGAASCRPRSRVRDCARSAQPCSSAAPRGGERDDVVDVAVGAVVLGDARRPARRRARRRGARRSVVLDLGAAHVGIAVRVEQAALGRDERGRRRRPRSTRLRAPSAPRAPASPRCAAIAPPTAASASHGDHFSPHALKRKCTRVRRAVGARSRRSVRRRGSTSRRSGARPRRRPAPHVLGRARRRRPGATTSVTGSCAAIGADDLRVHARAPARAGRARQMRSAATSRSATP